MPASPKRREHPKKQDFTSTAQEDRAPVWQRTADEPAMLSPVASLLSALSRGTENPQ